MNHIKIINLSFIISTRNRLPWLEIIFEHLLPGLQNDEEIVVVDGGSIDGSREYLQKLFDEGTINQYVSAPDQNQAHGWNKAILMAKGTLIKKIIDDDVFCYPAIRKCKSYMLENETVDVLISKDLGCNINAPSQIHEYSRLDPFLRWKNGIVPSFTFGDVHMLIRKRALSLIGLYNTSFIMIDWEYSLRISYLKTSITFYTGYNALSVSHPTSISDRVNKKDIELQGEVVKKLYQYAGDHAGMSLWSKVKIAIGKNLKNKNTERKSKPLTREELKSVYKELYEYLQTQNDKTDPEFI